MTFFIPRTANPSGPNAILHITERMIRSRYHWMERPYDHMIIVSVDSANKVMFLKRAGDQATNNGFPYRYSDSIATPTPGQNVIVPWDPSGPFVAYRLAT
jgi:hypothetical protein